MKIILGTLGGSHAYGVSTPESDIDLRGIFLPEAHLRNHLFKKVEQVTNRASLPDYLNQKIEDLLAKITSKKECDVVFYSLEKFVKLLAEANPNIVEILWTDDSSIFYCEKPIVSLLRENWNLFLSGRVKYSFVGYATSQLYKIERHRKWILKGELIEPKREDYGLPPVKLAHTDQIFSYISKQIDQWSFGSIEGLNSDTRLELTELVWEIIFYITKSHINWDNWSEEYEKAALQKVCHEMNLDKKITDFIYRENLYRKAVNEYKSWIKWKTERNPERKELELKCGYDSKHAMHLIRLMRMGYEIVTTGKVNVLRPDAKELMEIRNGKWSYDRIIQEAESIKQKIEKADCSLLHKKPDFEKINELYHQIVYMVDTD